MVQPNRIKFFIRLGLKRANPNRKGGIYLQVIALYVGILKTLC